MSDPTDPVPPPTFTPQPLSTKVPYVRKVEFLSHSALQQLEENPVEFYLQRCAPVETRPDKFQQDARMAVGSVFDAHVKWNLAQVVGCPCPPLEKLLNNVHPDNCKEVTCANGEVIHPLKLGKSLFSDYRDCGAFESLLKEGLRVVELEPAKDQVPGTERTLMGKEVMGVPIMGHPDAMLVDEHGARVVLDWKVTSAPSPKAGWRKMFSVNDPFLHMGPPHEKADLPMEQLDPVWASQLAVYSWLMRDKRVGNASYFMPVKVAIDQVVYGGACVKVAQFRTHISGQFQTQLRNRYLAAWKLIQEEQLVPPGVDLTLARLTRKVERKLEG